MMRDLRAAFLRHICARPDDDTSRLIFADWLDENGEPERAELIRVQCRIAAEMPALHSSRCNCRGCGLRRRERELLGSRGRAWAAAAFGGAWEFGRGGDNQFDAHRAGSPRILLSVAFRRGFVSSVRTSLDEWLARGRDFVLAAPVTDVLLVDKRPLPVRRAARTGRAGGAAWRTGWTGILSPPPDVLPDDLFYNLPGAPTLSGLGEGRTGRLYATRQEAVLALSWACVLTARDGARLPRLVPPLFTTPR